MRKRLVEIFTAGCPVCTETVSTVKNLSCPSCEVVVLDLHQLAVAERAAKLSIRSLPAVVVDGEVAAWADTERGHFNVATSVQVSPTADVVVADFYNHQIQVISREGEFLFSFGSKGSDEGKFDRPVDIAFDGEGHLYVVDFGNDRIQRFRPVY